MGKLTINLPHTIPGTPMTVPGIKGEFRNGESFDVPELEEDLVIGEPLDNTLFNNPANTDNGGE